MARGQITKVDGPRGVRYRITYDIAPDPATGKRRQRKETFRTKAEAESALASRLNSVRLDQGFTPSREVFRDFAKRYLEAPHNWKESTRHHRVRTVNQHLVPAFGSLPVQSITAVHVERFVQDCQRKGLAVGSVRRLLATLKHMFNTAVRWNIILRNPCMGVRAAGRETEPRKAWTAQEANAFLEGTRDHFHAPVFRLMIMYGPRIGEVVALRWSDVDWQGKQLHIRRTYDRLSKQDTRPKTRAGIRSIPIDDVMLDMLRDHRKRQLTSGGIKEEAEGRVFVGKLGGVLDPGSIDHNLRHEARRLGLPVVSPHELRHTAATMMMEAGLNPKIVQYVLGHESITLTLQLYSHVSPTMVRDSLQRMSDHFNDSVTGS